MDQAQVPQPQLHQQGFPYSRMMFFQCYPAFQRFDWKVFLTEALRYFGGTTARIMIDNTHVVVLRGAGGEMVPVLSWRCLPSVSVFSSWRNAIGNANTVGRAWNGPSRSLRITF